MIANNRITKESLKNKLLECSPQVKGSRGTIIANNNVVNEKNYFWKKGLREWSGIKTKVHNNSRANKLLKHEKTKQQKGSRGL